MRRLKKNLKAKLQNEPKLRVMFFDESRFGTHSKVGHGWFEKGVRTSVSISLGFKNFYVYSAVECQTGASHSLLMPYVNTVCFNIFLKSLSKQYPYDKLLFILDGAGWHKSKQLQIPHNIEFMYLPPYSPELNPVERLWNYIKQNTIKNKIYASLVTLENTICHFIKNIKTDLMQSICACSYM